MENKIFAFMLLVTAFGNSAFGQATSAKSTSQTSQSSSQSADAVPVSTTVVTLRSEGEALETALLREQIKITKEYQESLLSTVQFSIGGVVAIALFLAGFNWLTNFKLFENDKKRLVEEFDGRLLKFRSEIEGFLSANRVEVFNAMDERLEALSGRISTDMASLKADIRRDVERNIADIEKLAGKSEALAVDSAKLEGYVIKRTALLEGELRTVEEYLWDIKKIPGNVLITQAQALSAAVELESEFRVVRTLERMRNCISEDMLPKGDSLTLEVLDGIKKDVEAAEKFASDLAHELLALLEQIKIRPG